MGFGTCDCQLRVRLITTYWIVNMFYLFEYYNIYFCFFLLSPHLNTTIDHIALYYNNDDSYYYCPRRAEFMALWTTTVSPVFMICL